MASRTPSPILPSVISKRGHAPTFHTERFTINPLLPQETKNLLATLFQDPFLVEQVPCMRDDRSRDAALREAFGVQLECVARQAVVWGVVDREHQRTIGAVVARSSLTGKDIDILVASAFRGSGIGEEVHLRIAEWWEDHRLADPAFQ